MLFNYKYGGTSSVNSNASSTGMSFAPDALREPTYFVGQLNKKIAFREAISALNAVVVSDMRFKPKDKTAYLEWAAQQEEIWLAQYLGEIVGDIDNVNHRVDEIRSEINGIDKEQSRVMGDFYKSRRDYFNYLYQKDKDAWFVLDPVITTHPDSIFFECFSQDESSYGKLSCNYNVFKNISDFECGTTNIDYSEALYNEFQKVRNYKETELKVDPSGFEIQTGEEDLYKEVKIDLPDSWVRGFLQVSSAMTLPGVTFDLHPMDIYSLCLYLRRFKEVRGPRSLRFMLEPDKPIRVIVEPWNYELKFSRSIYKGPEAREIRMWGRRRLMILERLIPITKKFVVTMLGSGLPSFFEADLGDMTFTLGLSGWTANDWSRAGNFDLLAPRTQVDSVTQATIFNALKEKWAEDLPSLSTRLGMEQAVVAGALGAYTQAGRVIYDRYNGLYRVRELSREPLDMKVLRFASPIEEKANKLVDSNSVTVNVEDLGDGKIKLTGTVKERHRTHYPMMVIDSEDRIVEATCDCNHYNMNKLRKGPCEHMLALRMAYNKRIGRTI